MKRTSYASSIRVPSRSNWTKQEDETLAALVSAYGPQNWAVLANSLQGRTGKQCRERWHNHLAPGVIKTDWSQEEDDTLQSEFLKVGPKWAKIAEKLPGRTDNAVKNRFYSQKRKSERQSGRPWPYVPAPAPKPAAKNTSSKQSPQISVLSANSNTAGQKKRPASLSDFDSVAPSKKVKTSDNVKSELTSKPQRNENQHAIGNINLADGASSTFNLLPSPSHSFLPIPKEHSLGPFAYEHPNTDTFSKFFDEFMFSDSDTTPMSADFTPSSSISGRTSSADRSEFLDLFDCEPLSLQRALSSSASDTSDHLDGLVDIESNGSPRLSSDLDFGADLLFPSCDGFLFSPLASLADKKAFTF